MNPFRIAFGIAVGAILLESHSESLRDQSLWSRLWNRFEINPYGIAFGIAVGSIPLESSQKGTKLFSKKGCVDLVQSLCVFSP